MDLMDQLLPRLQGIHVIIGMDSTVVVLPRPLPLFYRTGMWQWDRGDLAPLPLSPSQHEMLRALARKWL